MEEKLGKWFSGDKKLKIYLVVGAVLVLLMVFGGKIFGEKKSTPAVDKVGEQTLSSYKEMLQTEVEQQLSRIKGVSEVSVMITLKGDAEYVYAKEERQTLDKTEGSEENSLIQQSDNYENNTIIVETEDGRKTALVKTRLEPKVKGVLVVCKGADNPVVEQKVTNAVKTVLSIGANNVCVVS